MENEDTTEQRSLEEMAQAGNLEELAAAMRRLAAAPAPEQPAVEKPVAVPAHHVKLSPFWLTCPDAWFGLAEAQFALRGVTDEQFRYYLVLGALPETTVRSVADLVAAVPPPPDAYHQLRHRLLAGHRLTEFQRMEKLLQVQPLGAQRPTELLADMVQLCPAGEAGTKLFRMLFLQRLPKDLRIILAEDETSGLQDLAARANILWSHASELQSSTVAAVGEDESSSVAAVRSSERGSGGRSNKSGRPERPKQASKKQDGEKKRQQESGLCYAHFHYGSQAFPGKCKQPCAWKAEN